MDVAQLAAEADEYKPARHYTIVLLGAAQSGKTTFAANASLLHCGSRLPGKPTRSVVTETVERDLPNGAIASFTTYEYGGSHPDLLSRQVPPDVVYPRAHLRTLCTGANVVGLFYKHQNEAHWRDVAGRWANAALESIANSPIQPFVFAVETYRDASTTNESLRMSKLRTETFLYQTFGRAFLFFQIDARSADMCSAVMGEIMAQLCVQKQSLKDFYGQTDAGHACIIC